MTSPAHRGLAVLTRHLHMTDRRRQQFHDHLLNRAPQPLAGVFHGPAEPGQNPSKGLGSHGSTVRFVDASNETRTTMINNKDENAMICQKTPLITHPQIEPSLETAHELERWATLCKERANQGVDMEKRLDKDGVAKLAMMSERFLRLEVAMAGRLEHPQLRSAAITLIAQHHLDDGHDRDAESALHHWPSMIHQDAIATLSEAMGQNPLPHWRFSAWGKAAQRQETALPLEAFAWLAGTQAMLNDLRQRAGMDTRGWDNQAVFLWSWIAAFLGQGHRYLSDEGWNERYLETQWRNNVQGGIEATLEALNTESSIVER